MNERGTHIIVGALCLVIALLLALSMGADAGKVDPPKQDQNQDQSGLKWEDIQTCMYECGGRSDV